MDYQLFVNYFCFRSILLNAFNTVEAVRLCCVAFACCDNFAVSCLETEAEFASLVSINFKLRMLDDFEVFNCLVFNAAYAVVLYAFNTLEACSFCCVNFTCCDNLAICWLCGK